MLVPFAQEFLQNDLNNENHSLNQLTPSATLAHV